MCVCMYDCRFICGLRGEGRMDLEVGLRNGVRMNRSYDYIRIEWFFVVDIYFYSIHLTFTHLIRQKMFI